MNTFAFPQAFWLLIVPFVLFFLLPKVRGLHGSALKVPFLNDLKNIKDKVNKSYIPLANSRSLFSLKFIYVYLLWTLLVTAIAKPMYIGEPHRLKSQHRDIMLVLDISNSMLKRDFSTRTRDLDRLTAVKAVIAQFIEERKSDRIGLILFGTRAYLQAPLTFDKHSVIDILMDTDAGMAGNSTSIGDALGLALKNLKDDKKNKLIILLTDGENNDGFLSMPKAIDIAEKEGIKIYTIGVGADRNFLDSLFSMGNSDLDEKSLKLLAQKTKGNYFRAKDFNSLSQIYAQIDKLEPQDTKENVIREEKELYYIPLMLALLFATFLIFIPRSFFK